MQSHMRPRVAGRNWRNYGNRHPHRKTAASKPLHPMDCRISQGRLTAVLSDILALDPVASSTFDSSPGAYCKLGIPETGLPAAFGSQWLARRFLKKCDGLRSMSGKVIELPKEANALQAEVDAWKACCLTNHELRNPDNDPELEATLFGVARVLSRLMGRRRPTNDHQGFGPGRNDVCHGKHVGRLHKYSARLTSTPENVPRLREVLKASPLWERAIRTATRQWHTNPAHVGPPPATDPFWGLKPLVIAHVPGNVMLLVNKDETTRRVIRYEPSGNLVVQRIWGRFFSQVLQYNCGICLEKSQPIHKFLALSSSRTSNYSTIDLKSASAHIATNLCREVLPDDVFHALDSCRSQSTLWHECLDFDNDTGFCSMGNGFTFEFQTLLYYAVAQYCLESADDVCGPVCSTARVFGDDVIIASAESDAFRWAITRLGFVVNSSKTFTEPHGFRESCGCDAYCGVDVTPPYLRKWPTTVSELLPFVNRLHSWITKMGLQGHPVGDEVRAAHADLTSIIDVASNTGVPRGPADMGDGHIWNDTWIDSSHIPSPKGPNDVDRRTWYFHRFQYTTFVRHRSEREQRAVSTLRRVGFHPDFADAALCASLNPTLSESLESSLVTTTGPWHRHTGYA